MKIELDTCDNCGKKKKDLNIAYAKGEFEGYNKALEDVEKMIDYSVGRGIQPWITMDKAEELKQKIKSLVEKKE